MSLKYKIPKQLKATINRLLRTDVISHDKYRILAEWEGYFVSISAVLEENCYHVYFIPANARNVHYGIYTNDRTKLIGTDLAFDGLLDTFEVCNTSAHGLVRYHTYASREERLKSYVQCILDNGDIGFMTPDVSYQLDISYAIYLKVTDEEVMVDNALLWNLENSEQEVNSISTAEGSNDATFEQITDIEFEQIASRIEYLLTSIGKNIVSYKQFEDNVCAVINDLNEVIDLLNNSIANQEVSNEVVQIHLGDSVNIERPILILRYNVSNLDIAIKEITVLDSGGIMLPIEYIPNIGVRTTHNFGTVLAATPAKDLSSTVFPPANPLPPSDTESYATYIGEDMSKVQLKWVAVAYLKICSAYEIAGVIDNNMVDALRIGISDYWLSDKRDVLIRLSALLDAITYKKVLFGKWHVDFTCRKISEAILTNTITEIIIYNWDHSPNIIPEIKVSVSKQVDVTINPEPRDLLTELVSVIKHKPFTRVYDSSAVEQMKSIKSIVIDYLSTNNELNGLVSILLEYCITVVQSCKGKPTDCNLSWTANPTPGKSNITITFF